MKLYHVSRIHAKKDILDMSIAPKNDIQFVHPMMVVAHSFENFSKAINSQLVHEQSKIKGWITQKIAAEAIFEYVRSEKYPDHPSRLLFSYFTDSFEAASLFNNTNREGQGAIFEFEAEKNKCYYYDMDIFDFAVNQLITGLTELIFNQIFNIADIYWQAKNNKNIEILYKEHPVLKRISYV